jgi:uncharacterized protein YukE
MSPRSKNDLTGCKNRIQSTLSKWRETTAEIQESWSDATAKDFYEQRLGEVEPTSIRTMACLQEAIDLVQLFEKRTLDPKT